jgi:hypothetical protein
VGDGAVKEEMLFLKALETTAKASDVLGTVSDFFKKMVFLGKS